MAYTFDPYSAEGLGLTMGSGYGMTSAVPAFKYKATTFGPEYSVQGLTYPEDLDSNKYGNNKVVFYINVSVDSKVLRNDEGALATVENVQRDMRGTLIGEKIGSTSASTTAAVLGGGAAVGVAGSAIGGALGIGSGAGAAAGLATGATAGYLAAKTNNQELTAAEAKAPTFARPQKRLKAAIALYVPNNLQIRYSVGWGEEDMMGLSAIGKLGEEAFRAQEPGNRSGIGAATGIAGEVLANLGISKAPLGGQYATAAGIAANPKKEQSFKNVDFRTFTMDYQFAPRNSSEASNVMNIIQAFKYHMHPEFKSEDKFLYIYPSEFDLVYYKNNTENLKIHRHPSCVLTEMNVNYAPNGVFTTFPDGMPTNINVQLTFRELQTLTKETIEKYT